MYVIITVCFWLVLFYSVPILHLQLLIHTYIYTKGKARSCQHVLLFSKTNVHKIETVKYIVYIPHSCQRLLGLNLSPEFVNLYFPYAGRGLLFFLLVAAAF